MIAARCLICLIAVAAGAAAAQPAPVPAPAPDASAPAPQAQPAAPTLGRLFFTPAERATLDEMRKRPAPVVEQEKPPAPPTPEYVTLNGVVRRSDGTTTVWLNNKPVQGQRSSEGLIVAPSRSAVPGNVTVVVPQSGRRVDLKVGQQLEVTSGQVQEPYRSSPRPASATAAADAPPSTVAATPERPSSRRPSRDRELLRELLREIDGPPAGQQNDPSGSPTPARPAPG